MVELFADVRAAAYKKKVKFLAVILACVACVAAAVCVTLVVFAKVNPALMKVCVCVIAVAAGWVCIALFGAYMAPYARRAAFESTVLSAAKVTLRGKIEVTSRRETAAAGVICAVMALYADGKTYSAYWDCFFGEPPFESGKEYEICLADNVVFAYGEGI